MAPFQTTRTLALIRLSDLIASRLDLPPELLGKLRVAVTWLPATIRTLTTEEHALLRGAVIVWGQTAIASGECTADEFCDLLAEL